MSLYSKTDLDRLAKESGFVRDNLEKIIRLIDVLKHFNTNPLLLDSVALKGGTAINLTVFDLPRLSVDIDLDFIKNCSKDEMLKNREDINAEIMSYMFVEDYTLSPHTKNPHSLDSWAFYYQNAAGNRDNIKIEINYSMRNHIYPLVKAKTNVSFLPSVEIQALAPLELFGSKIKALIERTATRDLYDVYNMITHYVFSENQLADLRKVVIFYLAVGGNNPPKTKYENFEAIDALNFSQFRANLIPVLRKSEHFDFETAKSVVKSFLSKLLKFTEREKRFIEEFNNQKYQPQLLFEEQEIIDSIQDHPMAVWKTRSIKY